MGSEGANILMAMDIVIITGILLSLALYFIQESSAQDKDT